MFESKVFGPVEAVVEDHQVEVVFDLVGKVSLVFWGAVGECLVVAFFLWEDSAFRLKASAEDRAFSKGAEVSHFPLKDVH